MRSSSSCLRPDIVAPFCAQPGGPRRSPGPYPNSRHTQSGGSARLAVAPIRPIYSLSLVRHEGKQRDVARPLDRLHDHPLVTRASASDSPRDDLAALGDELGAESARYHLLIVHECRFVHTEHADFAARFAKLARLAARLSG